MVKFTLKTSVLLLSFAALMSVVTNARASNRTQLSVVPVAELKAIYLECDQLASTNLLDFDTAVKCSMIYEELLKRGFGGSIEEFVQWWRSVRDN